MENFKLIFAIFLVSTNEWACYTIWVELFFIINWGHRGGDKLGKHICQISQLQLFIDYDHNIHTVLSHRLRTYTTRRVAISWSWLIDQTCSGHHCLLVAFP